MKPESAKSFWEKFVERVKKSYKVDLVKGFSVSSSILTLTEGVFGAMMNVQIENDG